MFYRLRATTVMMVDKRRDSGEWDGELGSGNERKAEGEVAQFDCLRLEYEYLFCSIRLQARQ